MPIDIAGRDLRQWTQDGVVKIDKTGDFVLVTDFDGDYGLSGICFRKNREPGGVRYTNEHVSLWWPELGSVNICLKNGFCFGVHLYRRSGRSYLRTYSASQVGVVIPREWDIAKEMGIPPSVDLCSWPVFAALEGASKYPTYENALRTMLDDTRVLSVAISRSIILYFNGVDTMMVHFRGEHVGDINVNSGSVTSHKGGAIEKRIRKIITKSEAMRS